MHEKTGITACVGKCFNLQACHKKKKKNTHTQPNQMKIMKLVFYKKEVNKEITTLS